MVPVVMLLVNIFVISREKENGGSRALDDESMSKQGQTAYLAQCVSLLVVVCMVPCICYFKVACNFEQKLFVQHQQLMLAAALHKSQQAR